MKQKKLTSLPDRAMAVKTPFMDLGNFSSSDDDVQSLSSSHSCELDLSGLGESPGRMRHN